MKKQIISAMAILVLLFGPMTLQNANAQVFLDEEGGSKREGYNTPDLPGYPQLGVDIDQYKEIEEYTPLGSGVLALGLLGGAYLLGKKRKGQK